MRVSHEVTTTCAVCGQVRVADDEPICRWCVADEVSTPAEWQALQIARQETGNPPPAHPSSSSCVEVPSE